MPPTLAGETQETPPGLPWAGERRGLRDRVFGGHRAAPPPERGTEAATVRASKKAPRWEVEPRLTAGRIGLGSEYLVFRGVREVAAGEAPRGCPRAPGAPYLWLELAVHGSGRAALRDCAGEL